MITEEKSIGAITQESISNDESESFEWTDLDEARIRKKTDWRIIPTISLLYLMCFIDRSNIGNARIQGLTKDLNLYGYRFNWALTIFYISYITFEIPSNILLKKIGARYYLPSLTVAFGLVSMCTAFLTNYSGLLTVRFFLGVAEAGLLPGAAYYISCFYRRHEYLFRLGLFMQGTSLAGAFGGLLAAGLSSIPSWGTEALRIHAWRNIFFFEGLFTVLISGLAIFVLPQTPDKSRFLNPRDQLIALERINREHKESATERIKLRHIRQAVFNINNIIVGLGYFCTNVTVQSFSLFLPSILSALGWTALKTQFYTVPPYCVGFVWSITVFRLSDHFRRRGIFVLFNGILAITGYAILATATSNSVKYGAVFLACMGAFPNGPIFLAWGLNNAGGTNVRAVTGAYILTIGGSGALVATWTYLDRDKPEYRRGHWINVGTTCGAMLLAACGIAYTKWENKRRDKGERNGRLTNLTDDEKNVLGYRHPEFRYIS